MHRVITIFILFSSLISSHLFGQNRNSSYPLITGDTFRAYADHIFDETDQRLNPRAVGPKNTIFVKTDLLSDFFEKIHPFITCSYILITHNSDFPVPGAFARYLDDDKVIAWFGQNVENYSHPKLHPIPIGIENRYNFYGKDVHIYEQKISNLFQIPKTHLLYMNFSPSTHPERQLVVRQFNKKPFCFCSMSKKTLEYYLTDLASSQFVLSPRGNGLDCHRTWEALYMGAFPIFKTSSSDSLYENLPVIIIQDWSEITETYLRQKYQEMQTQKFQWEKLYFDYWANLINSYK